MNIVVLAGGISTERDVSLTSGQNVVRALRKGGYNAVLLDVYLGYDSEDWQDFFLKSKEELAAVSSIGLTDPSIDAIKAARGASADGFFGPNVLNICRMADFTFLALHGEDGENGKVQACFDLLGIRYTGTGCLGSAIAMNKSISKQVMQANGIVTADYIVLHKGVNEDERFPVPCVIKPSSGGSSVGVSIVTDEKDYDRAVEAAFKYESEVVVEKYIKGREFSIGVLGDTVLPPIEIIPKAGFYDYANKYQPGMTEEICPAVLTEEETEAGQAAALAVFKALGLQVYGRVDFILNEADGKFYALEANSLPGMTGMSLLPQEAAAVGIGYEQLCAEIISLSGEKYKEG